MVDILRTNQGFTRPDTDQVFPTRQAAKQWQPTPVAAALKSVYGESIDKPILRIPPKANDDASA